MRSCPGCRRPKVYWRVVWVGKLVSDHAKLRGDMVAMPTPLGIRNLSMVMPHHGEAFPVMRHAWSGSHDAKNHAHTRDGFALLIYDRPTNVHSGCKFCFILQCDVSDGVSLRFRPTDVFGDIAILEDFNARTPMRDGSQINGNHAFPPLIGRERVGQAAWKISYPSQGQPGIGHRLSSFRIHH